MSSLARREANVTGSTYFNPELAAKRLVLLKEAMPGLTNLGIGWPMVAIGTSRHFAARPDNPTHHCVKMPPGDFVVRTNVTTLTDYSPRYLVIGYSLAL